MTHFSHSGWEWKEFKAAHDEVIAEHNLLKEYVEYFMTRRPHQGLEQQVPDSRGEFPTTGRIRCRQMLGGLIKDYYREAA